MCHLLAKALPRVAAAAQEPLWESLAVLMKQQLRSRPLRSQPPWDPHEFVGTNTSFRSVRASYVLDSEHQPLIEGLLASEPVQLAYPAMRECRRMLLGE
jgi:hypothetical protein